MSNTTLAGQVIAITGAASGIGRALALAAAAEGASVALSDLQADAVREVAALAESRGAPLATAHPLDVSDRAAVEAWAADVLALHGRVDVVVNNAGVSLSDSVARMTYDDLEWIVGINLWGVVYGTKAFLPALLQQGHGQVINISSVFGLIGVPSQSAYNITKFGVRGFTESLRQELRHTDLVITCVHPGGIRTNIARNGRFRADMAGSTDHEKAARAFEAMARTSPEQAAAALIDAITHKQTRVLIGPDARLIDLLQRLMPSAYEDLLAAFLRARTDPTLQPALPPRHDIPLRRALCGLVGRLSPPVRPDNAPSLPALDPHTAGLQRLAAWLGRPKVWDLDPLLARRNFDRDMRDVAGQGPPMKRVLEATVDTPAGPLPYRLYTPPQADDRAPSPAMVWFHGGGFVLGDLRSHDPFCRLLAAETGWRVLSVAYRLAPEHPFPAAWDDALAAWRWVASHAEHLRLDPARIAVGGDSAGGTLAAHVAQATRDDARRPALQVLLYPSLNRVHTPPSRALFAQDPILGQKTLDWFTLHTLSPGDDPADPRLSPALAPDLRGLPPAHLIASGFDPLRDDAADYAERLRAASVPVLYRCEDPLPHGFCLLHGVSPACEAASARLARDARDALDAT